MLRDQRNPHGSRTDRKLLKAPQARVHHSVSQVKRVIAIGCRDQPGAWRMHPRGECILEDMVLEDVTASRLRPQQTAPDPTRIGVASSPPPHRLPLRETVPPLRRTTSRVRGNLHRAPREQSSAVRARAGGPGRFGPPSIQMSVIPNWSETWPEGRELEKITPLRTGRQT